jgi:hypothetical protein
MLNMPLFLSIELQGSKLTVILSVILSTLTIKNNLKLIRIYS